MSPRIESCNQTVPRSQIRWHGAGLFLELNWIRLIIDTLHIQHIDTVFKVFKIPIRQKTEVNWHAENLRVFITMTFLSLLLKHTFNHFLQAPLVLPPPGVCTFRPPHVQRLGDGCVTAWSLESAGLLPGPRILSGSRHGKK